jgi:hypothetical protein
MTKQYFWVSSVILLITGCGGGGGDNTSADNSTPVVQKTYVSSATAGEVLKYSVDTSAKTYSYEILQSAYGLQGSKGSGTLFSNSDGTYSPSESPGSKILPLKNGLLLGNVKLNMGGTSRDVPIFGMENPSTTSSDIAGIFNFITIQCSSQSNGIYSNCNSLYGSVEVTALTNTTATFKSCIGSDIAINPVNCSTPSSGKLNYLSDGVWSMKEDRSNTADNFFIAFKAPNGQKIGWIDFNDPVYFGFGQGVISQKTTIRSGEGIDGDYFYKNTLGQTGSVTLASNNSTLQVSTSTGVVATANQPWAGFSKSQTGYGLMAGNGVYVYMDPGISTYYYEIGIQK